LDLAPNVLRQEPFLTSTSRREPTENAEDVFPRHPKQSTFTEDETEAAELIGGPAETTAHFRDWDGFIAAERRASTQ